MILVTHFACCHQHKGYWRSCPLVWSYFTVMPGRNLRADGAHAPEFTDNWNVPGIYFAEDDALVYNVSAAYRPSPKGGWTVKRPKEAAAAAALPEIL